MSRNEDWSLTEWRDYYEKLELRAYMNYQETGISRYDNEQYKYSKIVDAFNGYIAYREEVDNDRLRRRHNIQAYADQHVNKETYSRSEVLKMLNDISTF